MPDGLIVEVVGLDRLIERLSPEQVRKGILAGLDVARVRAHRTLAENLSGRILGSSSGRWNLRRRISTRVEESNTEFVVIITNTARWRWKGKEGSLLKVHEDGATIVPRDPGGYLRFKWGKGKNDWAQVKKVVIPARRPLSKTMQEIKSSAVNDVRLGLIRSLRGGPMQAPDVRSQIFRQRTLR